MTLEEKIKALLEGNSKTVVSETELVEATEKINKDGSMERIDDDEKDDDKDEDSKEKTDVAADAETPNEVDTNEDEESEDDSEDDEDKKEVKEEASNEKLKVGLGKKDPMPKVTEPSTAKTGPGDEGLNAKLKVGLGKKQASELKSAGAGDNESNKKNNVDKQTLTKEHITAMFQGQELSEEFVEKASTIFEAAVAQMVEQRLEEEMVALQEEFQVKLDEAVEEVQGELVEQVDGFLNFVVEQWLEDNAVALESGIKVEMVSSFIDGMKKLFTEHYIEVPEEKLDVIEEQAARIAELEEVAVTLDESNDQLEAELIAAKRQLVIEHVSVDLTMTQKQKFAGLVENVEFTSDEEFENAIKTIKEGYFPASSKVESPILVSEGAAPIAQDQSDAFVSATTKALASQLKFK